MKRFEILVKGDNLLLNIDGEHCRCGFTAKRYIQATDAEQASKAVLIEVRQHPALKERLFDAGRILPRIRIEIVTEIGWMTFWRKRNEKSFDFFLEGDETLTIDQQKAGQP